MRSPSDAQPAPDARLVRALGVRALAANVVNCIVGSGIFVLPATVAAILGPSGPVAYLVCAAAMALVALCFAEIGSRVAVSGGTYAYVEAAFGPYVGFLAGVLFWFGAQVTASAAIAAVCADSLLTLVPALSGPVARGVLVAALYTALALLNVRGVRAGARVMEWLTAAKIAPLALLVVAGASAVRGANLAGMHLPPLADLGRTSVTLLFAFVGVEGALTSSGEVRDPARTVPRAILLGMGGVALLYGGLQVVSQGVLGASLAAEQTAPLAAVGARVAGALGRNLVLAAAALSAFGYLSGDVLATPRILFAFAEDGILPARVAAVHARLRTPHVAIVVHAAVCTVVALSGTFRGLVVLSSVATLLVYLGCCMAVLELRRRDVRADGPPFRVPGGPVVPVLACAVVAWLLASATRAEYVAVGVMVAVASLLYAARRTTVGRGFRSSAAG